MAAECINLAVKYITEGITGLKLNKNELKRLFEFATKETSLPIQRCFLRPGGWCSHGLPLVPVLSNLLYLK